MSYTQTDLTNASNAESHAKAPAVHGRKLGMARCTFDATGGKAIGAHGSGLTIPKDCIVRFCAYRVTTTFTSATDAATIAIKIVSANDVVSAVAISNGGNPWDAGNFETVPKIETSTTWLTTTADSEVTFTVAAEALTAGKLVLFVEWMYFGDVA